MTKKCWKKVGAFAKWKFKLIRKPMMNFVIYVVLPELARRYNFKIDDKLKENLFKWMSDAIDDSTTAHAG